MMPLCVYADVETGFLHTVGQLSESCTGYVLMTAADYAGSLTITQLFGWPEPEAFGLAFMAAFGAVLGCAVVAHVVGSVAGFFDSAREEEL